MSEAKLTGGAVSAALAALAALFAAGCGGRSEPLREAATAPAAGAPLVLVTTGQTPPYSYRDGTTGEIVGEEIEIARAAAKKLGRELTVRIAKFPELLPLVGSGEADLAASGITITEGRRQTVDFSEPYTTEGGMFLYRSGETAPTMFRAERMRVATIDASTYDFYLTFHGIDPLRFETFESAMEAFGERRVDTVFYDSCTARLVAERSGGKIAATPLQTRENFGIAVRKGNRALKDALDEAISERRAP